MFDGESATLVNDAVVLMDDGRIVGIQSGAPAPEGVELVDLGDVTLLPGLIDAHVHLAFDAGPDAVGRLMGCDDDEVLDGMHTAARTALGAGVTTVRDLGDRGYLALKLRDELAGEPSAGPEVLAAGPPITTSRGHCWFLGGEADGVDGVRAAVREHVERGVDVIKVMASGGEVTDGSHSHLPQYGLAELRAAADEAHRAGLPITAHAHAGQAIADVVAAGFDSIEHCSFMTEDGVEPRPEVIAALARADIAVSATLGFLPGLAPPPGIVERIPAFMAVLRQLDEAGVTLVCGTDAGIGPPKPHGILPLGVAMLTDVLGWTAVDALRSATSVAARVCHVGDRKGRLVAGYDADILAVAGNPLDDISALHEVRAVIRAGHPVTT